MVFVRAGTDNGSTFTFHLIPLAEAFMLALLFLTGAALGAAAVYRSVRFVRHSIPRANDELIFF